MAPSISGKAGASLKKNERLWSAPDTIELGLARAIPAV